MNGFTTEFTAKERLPSLWTWTPTVDSEYGSQNATKTTVIVNRSETFLLMFAFFVDAIPDVVIYFECLLVDGRLWTGDVPS